MINERDAIVDRVLRNKKKINFLNEDFNHINEADEDKDKLADEEYAALNKEDDQEDEEHDDSKAPEQGNPDESEDEEIHDFDPPAPISKRGSSSQELPTEADSEIPPEVEDTVKKEEPSETTAYDNPLDNQYAVKFTLGNEVQLQFEGDSQVIRKGEIDGYDVEGFYRVRWADGTTTSGLTDIALSELVANKMSESNCICGSKEFINEGKYVICDKCGRRIKEGATLLQLADKSINKGKRLIRSEAHPMSTSSKPSINESGTIKDLIKEALKSRHLKESEEDEIEDSIFDELKDKLDNQFWTRQDELVEDIEELGYIVEEINGEYVVVSSEEDDENVYQIFLGGTSRTMTLDFNRARMM